MRGDAVAIADWRLSPTTCRNSNVGASDDCESCCSTNGARLMALAVRFVRDESLSGAELPLLIVARLHFHDAAEMSPIWRTGA